ncbi:N-acetylmuramoyl-L-alanine amidase [Methylacidiphilum sp. Yel]|uniref:N-acetylmuramoyl-L-alanine amidase family protein n=1 Tax=Methylacidiphilum sp. Yel TaxID=1847730 RepID=UPI00106D1F07|nr:N-acetylmuramoyl-L-alanine amidase [Methylacidiphilum sp. Yel]TFE66032.1 N-acetylmuramoyl-L-alanine amidase [Methylacidiphilum sp. Yel]
MKISKTLLFYLFFLLPTSLLAIDSFTTVLIDPGHGGIDNGGSSGRKAPYYLMEKELTLDIARRLANVLRRMGFRVIMTRTDDRFVDLDERVRIANELGKRAILVSIHCDALSNRKLRGIKTYFWHANSYGLATRIQRSLVKMTGAKDLGVIRRRLRLTRNPTIPSVLCECGFMTNPFENKLLASPSYRQTLAIALAKGINEEKRLGDFGISSVPEIWAPLSRPTDAHRHVYHKKTKKRKQLKKIEALLGIKSFHS